MEQSQITSRDFINAFCRKLQNFPLLCVSMEEELEIFDQYICDALDEYREAVSSYEEANKIARLSRRLQECNDIVKDFLRPN